MCTCALVCGHLARQPPLPVDVFQYGGIDSFRNFPFEDCNTFDLAKRQWQQQPWCTYVDTTGPYLTWDAASAVLPNRREALMLGGRITSASDSGVSWLVPPDEHWAIDLDTLSWRRLSGDPLFWGLPKLAGWCMCWKAAPVYRYVLRCVIAGARAVTVPFPDGSAGILVWGGITSNMSAITRRLFMCGITVRTEVAAFPSVLSIGSILGRVLFPNSCVRNREWAITRCA